MTNQLVPSDQSDQLKALLFLMSHSSLGCVKIYRLINKLGDISQLLNLNSKQLQDINLDLNLGLDQNQIKSISNSNSNNRYADQQLELALKNKCEIISYYDPDYPELLKEIYDPPLLLYLKGNKKLLSSLQIGIVGSRKPTIYGRQYAEYLTKELLQYGYTITSGFAMGVDIIAHLTAVSAKMPTIAVLGTSLDCIYPSSHKNYVGKILDTGGLFVSENSFTTPPHPSVFPRRNRIISGLSRGVLIVEAARKSGSLITARCAMEQSREVFALPGNINNPKALGCLDLIAIGAKLVIDVNSIVEELTGIKVDYKKSPIKTRDKNQNKSQDKSNSANSTINCKIKNTQETGLSTHIYKDLNPRQLTLLDSISGAVSDFDNIVINSKIPAHEIAAELVQLEIRGYIAEVPGGYIRAIV